VDVFRGPRSCRGPETRGSASTFAGVIWINDRFPTRIKLNSRAASNALIASFTRERGTKLPKNDYSCC